MRDICLERRILVNKRFLILIVLLCGLIFSVCGKENENSNNKNLEEYAKEDNRILNENQQENPKIASAEAITYYETFRTYMELMYKFERRIMKEDNLFDTGFVYPYVASMEEYYTNFLFTMERSTKANVKLGFPYKKYKFIHALPVPGLLEGEKFKNQAQAFLIVVNPKSERLEWVLEYLDEVCEGIREDEYSLMLKTNDFSDKPIWQEMQEILTDAEIYFKYPYEIVLNEMNAYLREEKSYEDTINEMERKMNMYLNE